MDAKYKINWLEIKTGKSGKQYMVMHLLDSAGKETQNVSTFELQYTLSQEIEGQIVQNGNFLNWKPKLDAPEFMKKAGNPAYKTQQIEKSMERKETSIKSFQASKDESIMWSSCFRDATLLTIAELGQGNKDAVAIQETWLRWREWLLNRFNNDDLKEIIPPFN